MTQARFLFTLWPFTSHLSSHMSLALALRERGHRVAFYSGGSVRSLVEQEGFEFFGFERVDEERAFRNLYGAETGGPRAGGGRRLVRILRDWRVETIPAQLADLNPVLDRWRPDVIATDPSLWSPIVVLHESQPIPVAVASAFMGPVMPARTRHLGGSGSVRRGVR